MSDFVLEEKKTFEVTKFTENCLSIIVVAVVAFDMFRDYIHKTLTLKFLMH